MKYSLDMTTGNLLKKIILYSLPLIATSILQLLYNTCDVIVVGQFAGKTALAAVGANSALINLIVNLFLGLSVGASVAYARSIGEKDYEKANRVVHTSIIISLASGVILTIIGLLGARQFLTWMGCPSDVIDLAVTYLRIYSAGFIFNIFYYYASAVVRAHGDTKRPLIILAIAGVLNVSLNLLFVIAFQMSVAGVALATIISQAFSSVAIIIVMAKEKSSLNFSLKKLKLDVNILKSIVKVGLPSGIQGSLFSISNVIIQSSINSFGTVVIAGNTTASNIEGFVYVSMNAFHQAAVNFSSQNYGAHNYKNIEKVLLYCLICVSVVGLVLGFAGYFLGGYICQLYSSDPAVIEIALVRMSYVCATYATCGVMDVLTGSLRGVEYSFVPMIVSILGICVYRVAWIYTLFANNRTLPMLYVTYPISWIITIIVLVICILIVFPRIKKKTEA